MYVYIGISNRRGIRYRGRRPVHKFVGIVDRDHGNLYDIHHPVTTLRMSARLTFILRLVFACITHVKFHDEYFILVFCHMYRGIYIFVHLN
ncbi:hypothetical protein NY2A_b520R [Paramecium bursaria Chlorella virus NY2A]|uniref:Uncharacterized protein b520R n=1 Tax=Paramecium bursaria Chlorella virus NY2A TaxID=46021 RepID=A7IX45_PBCVN|nr:hypothetical protein NY2A_b520R [Paramecium bursaria Chlorella virus NY2A]YP_001498541.1 hypothetical protein AR158_c460R [Paramecium bursaria Chlorella virus AR158]ABT14919.1 hypothetical protein NY2A_b520R [Paramecium bursaria Chlorella virus NY2A]ABU44005.1 hypothetical protein AR158_c460R [Paramecium bursaria Chlorella virus AR158]